MRVHINPSFGEEELLAIGRARGRRLRKASRTDVAQELTEVIARHVTKLVAEHRRICALCQTKPLPFREGNVVETSEVENAEAV